MEERPPWARPLVLLLTLPLLAACAEEREYPRGQECFAWKQDIGPLLEARCGDCHGGDEPAGDYRLTSYLAAIGGGSDGEPNAASGEASSLLLTKLDPDAADEVHHPFAEEVLPLLRTWVVDCDLAFTDSPIHEPGILNPRDEDFHGHLLRETLYDFDRCAECHGDDFGGGAADASCLSCHENGPTDCTTCHSDLPGQGAHAAHIPSPPTFGVECETCHVVPAAWDDVGHVFLDDGSLDPYPAEVMLSGKAAADGPSGSREGPPSWDAEAGRCNNVYCHGDTYADAEAAITEPLWAAGMDQAACGTCHGLPPSDHGLEDPDACVLCHGQVVDAELNIIVPELHIDTMVQVGPEGAGECTGCHGSGDDPAPPPDLAGRRSEALVTVGAHQAHLGPPFRVSGPVECGACHLVPESVTSPGHIDDDLPAEVFPGSISGDSLAFADGATPTWDRETETCSQVYCHGAGATLDRDVSEGMSRTPTWTAPFADEIYCGSCHGIPPTDPGDHFTHLESFTLADCATCHLSVDGFGNILFEGPPEAPTSLHMNGVVDVR